MAGILRALAIGLVLCIPLPRIARSKARLTWPTAVLLGTLLTVIGLVFLAEVPSRILYWVDSRSGTWSEQVPLLKPLLVSKGGSGQSLLADIAANTIGFIFFAILLGLVYFWGEKQRRAGRFSRR